MNYFYFSLLGLDSIIKINTYSYDEGNSYLNLLIRDNTEALGYSNKNKILIYNTVYYGPLTKLTIRIKQFYGWWLEVDSIYRFRCDAFTPIL